MTRAWPLAQVQSLRQTAWCTWSHLPVGRREDGGAGGPCRRPVLGLGSPRLVLAPDSRPFKEGPCPQPGDGRAVRPAAAFAVGAIPCNPSGPAGPTAPGGACPLAPERLRLSPLAHAALASCLAPAPCGLPRAPVTTRCSLAASDSRLWPRAQRRGWRPERRGVCALPAYEAPWPELRHSSLCLRPRREISVPCLSSYEDRSHWLGPLPTLGGLRLHQAVLQPPCLQMKTLGLRGLPRVRTRRYSSGEVTQPVKVADVSAASSHSTTLSGCWEVMGSVSAGRRHLLTFKQSCYSQPCVTGWWWGPASHSPGCGGPHEPTLGAAAFPTTPLPGPQRDPSLRVWR